MVLYPEFIKSFKKASPDSFEETFLRSFKEAYPENCEEAVNLSTQGIFLEASLRFLSKRLKRLLQNASKSN